MVPLGPWISAAHTMIFFSDVHDYLNILLAITKNIQSHSVLYNPLEILLHCQFKGFSFPPQVCDADFRANVISDLSLCELSICPDLFDAVAQQAKYICNLENNTMFTKLINELSSSSTSLANSLKKAVVTEMTQFPDEYTNNFPSKNRFLEFLSSEDIDFNSPAVTNSVCVAIASALKSVVICCNLPLPREHRENPCGYSCFS
jgi:hypothetical protein